VQRKTTEQARATPGAPGGDGEASFRAARLAALAQINVTTYPASAAMIMLFSWWDWFVDPVNWRTALAIRSAGSVVIVASGLVQHFSRRIDWAAAIARVRYTAGVLAVAGALAVLEQGYVVGVAGLIAVMLSGPYIALDRRDLLLLNVLPAIVIGAVMYAAGLDRFAVINAWVFIALAIAVSLLLARVFEAANRRTFALEQQLMREARTDALTGLLNRRALEEIAHLELRRSDRADTPMSVILCDIDHFKAVNDRDGHAAGDRVIRAVGERLRAELRETDTFGRWGGEEFIAILPATRVEAARVLAERMRAAIEHEPVGDRADLRVTVSLGIAERAAAGAWDVLVKAADDALYRAKAQGRNRVVVATATT
jgi:diguanylate cyclase (GGDEF)-like protein